ncbi:hypothetical protein KM043_010283 [Ampulex compressa]|nr:hypothetical protein KM043_010283 [Ampulex compressa]
MDIIGLRTSPRFQTLQRKECGRNRANNADLLRSQKLHRAHDICPGHYENPFIRGTDNYRSGHVMASFIKATLTYIVGGMKAQNDELDPGAGILDTD